MQMEARLSPGFSKSYDTQDLIRRIDHFPINDFKEISTGEGRNMKHYRHKYDIDNGHADTPDYLKIDFANSTDEYGQKESSLFKTSVGIIQRAETTKPEFSHYKALRTAMEIRTEMKAKILLDVVGAKVDVTTVEYTRFKN
jgi:hypothetical protein